LIYLALSVIGLDKLGENLYHAAGCRNVINPQYKGRVMMIDQNLLLSFQKTVQKLQSKSCVRYKSQGQWVTISWKDFDYKLRCLSAGLIKLGVQKGDAISLLSGTRYEWTLCDMGVLSVGGIVAPIYQSNTPDQCEYIVSNSDSKIVVVEDEKQLQKILSAKSRLPLVSKIILIQGESDNPDVVTLTQLMKEGSQEPDTFDERIQQIQPTDIATFVYTSGTTGPPKGVILSHENFLYEVQACRNIIEISENETGLLFLPLAHIFARVMQFYHLNVGFTHSYAESIEKLIDNIGEERPHFMVSVPRIFEKIYERIMSQVDAGSPIKKALFYWADSLGRSVVGKTINHQPVSLSEKLQYALASKIVFKKIRGRMGGRLKFCVAGGAPLSSEINEFFNATGVRILEGYGLTETTAAIACNSLDSSRVGSVGRVVDGVEIRIAEDGEIMARGKLVFQGYYKNQEATNEVMADDGWFHTGDVGEIDSDGYLRITDRKKDIIVTAAGKNIAPQNIENLIKADKYISQAVVLGDKRKYLSALITLNKDEILTFAETAELSTDDYSKLLHGPQIHDLIKRIIDEKNKKLARFETVKKFAILDGDFSQETGELTPTLKVKRRFVNEKYKSVLDRLYQE
jgi:long-chain acyl-CoA synthetase